MRIAAAISVKPVLEEVVERFRASRPGQSVLASYGASGTLARQLEAGAPFDLVVLADRESVSRLAHRELLADGPPSLLAWNALVLVSLEERSVEEPLASLANLEGSARLVIGDPSYVPLGRYAKRALQALGLWEELKQRVVLAPDAAATLAYVERGEAELGLVYATDAGRSTLVNLGPLASGHEALTEQPVVLAALAARAQKGAADLLSSLEASRELFAELGFEVEVQ